MKESRFLGRRYRLWVFALFAVAVVPVLWGAKKAWDSNANRVEDWLPESFEETQRLYWFAGHFGSDEILMVSWPGCTFDDPRIGCLAAALCRSRLEDGVEKPPLFRAVFTGPQVLQKFMAEIGLSRRQALRRLEGWLVGKDHHTTCIVALVSDAGIQDRHAAVDWVYECALSVCGLAREEIHVAGSTVDGVEIDRTSEKSLLRLNGVSFLICIVLMWFFLRSVRLAALVFVVAFFCEQFGMALVYYTGSQVDSVLLLMASLVYVLSISAAVHLVNYYREAIETDGLEGAVGRAVGCALLPCGLAAGTTALGLGSLGVSQIVPIAKFGVYSAAAVLCGFVLLFLFLPAALEQWPMRGWASAVPGLPSAGRAGGAPNGWERWQRSSRWSLLMRVVNRCHLGIVAVVVVTLVFAGFGVAKIRTVVSLHDFFTPDAKIIRDYDWLESNVGPLVPVEVVLRFPKDNRASLLEHLVLVERVRATIEKIDDVGVTISAGTFAPRIPKGARPNLAGATRWVVTERRLARHRSDFIAVRYLCDTDQEELWRISVRVPAGNNVEFGPFLKELQQQVNPVIEAAAGSFPGVRAEFCGGVPLVHEAQHQLLQDLIKSFLLAFVLIGITMAVLLRSVWAGALSMIPNIWPSVLVFGIMGWVAFEVEIGSMMTASAALGIAVDGTLHFVTWFRRGLSQGYSRKEAVLFAYTQCGTAMTETSLICGFGMLVFAISPFTPIARFAWLMFTLLTAALVGDLIVLPAILIGPLGRIFQPRGSRPDPTCNY